MTAGHSRDEGRGRHSREEDEERREKERREKERGENERRSDQLKESWRRNHPSEEERKDWPK